MFKQIVVGISGGVDSAVASLLLKKKGFNVTACFMKNWDIIDEIGNCQVEQDYEHAKWICKMLDIPLIEVNFVKDYWNEVFSEVIENYQSGLTPNPDMQCNKKIKFDKFFHFARYKIKADAIAMGHYAKTTFGPYLEEFNENTNVRLLQAVDPTKDQTFFLSQVPQESLRRCMFPLGNYFKSEVKRIALHMGLKKIVEKKESMGMCFIGNRNFKDFISEYVDNKPGNFIDTNTGVLVGKHNGIHQWTIGQCIKIKGCQMQTFVYRKDLETNNIFVVQGTKHPSLYTDLLVSSKPYWINEEPRKLQDGNVFTCYYRFQHLKPCVQCKVYKTINNRLIVLLDEPLRAITKGQFSVFYLDDECLGSAQIIKVGPPMSSYTEEKLDISENISMESSNQ